MDKIVKQIVDKIAKELPEHPRYKNKIRPTYQYLNVDDEEQFYFEMQELADMIQFDFEAGAERAGSVSAKIALRVLLGEFEYENLWAEIASKIMNSR